MGLAASKVCNHVPQKDLQEGSIPSTPILTPKVVKQDENLDPRSPSTHISRTPLQLLSAATLKLDELKESDSNITPDVTPAKPKGIILGMDPRSPTEEFKRTPIIINVSESDITERIHNKNLDRVKCSVITTPKSASKKQISDKKSPIVPPKLLESTPAKVRPDAAKRKSFVGLLETNIDFTETDLDAVIREKNKIKEVKYKSNEIITPRHKQLSTVVLKENIDPRSPTNDFLRTPIQIIKKIADLDVNDTADVESECNCIENRSNQNKIAVELEDHKIVEKCVQELCEKVYLKIEADSCEDDIIASEIPIQTKSAPITPPVTDNLKLGLENMVKEIKSAPITPPVMNLAADVKEFDKKLTSLIYHDEDIVICPRKVKLKDYDCRSPLRNINSNDPEKKKSAQKLKVKESMKKSEYTVSKIPVFREKGKKPEIQCENTPPRNIEKRKVKVRKSHWDNADTTLII